LTTLETELAPKLNDYNNEELIVDPIVNSCPNCSCIDQPEILVRGEVILAICPRCRVVRSKQPWF
jgi:hypothetical protein